MQGGNWADPALTEVLAPMVAGMTATRASLLEWVHTRGLVALREVFRRTRPRWPVTRKVVTSP